MRDNAAIAEAREEVLVLLSMSSETLDELTTMFVAADAAALTQLGDGDMRRGLADMLDQLRSEGLVRTVEQDPSFWEPTNRGRVIAADVNRRRASG